ncbi:MAG: hypothetical protein DYG90_05705 [Chloroflexi bacterium CFX6]|nr:hypothetical protein [Chloroflexi bacterium CFX6]
MNWTVRTAVATAAAAFAIGVVSGTSWASAPVDKVDPGPVAPPEASTFDNVIDAAEMEAVVDINERIEAHLYIDADGLVQLDSAVTAAQLGVTDEFLTHYRAALAESNKLIERGEITVDADMRVTPTEHYLKATRPAQPMPGGPTLDGVDAVELEAAPDTAVPDWSVWNYNTGAMYYNSYNTYNTYRYNYYGLCNSMAAYLRCSSCAPSLQYFYTYNSSYNSSYCYSNSGLYYYLPYNTNRSGCGQSYNPCYGSLGYKPAYYWGQTRTYNYSCRCYQQQWQWNGYWCRY